MTADAFFPITRGEKGNGVLSRGTLESALEQGRDATTGNGGDREEVIAPENGNLWVWKVAAVAVTLTAASLVTRRVMAGAGTLSGMPWAASGLRQGGVVTLECLAEGEHLNMLVKPRHGKLTSRRNVCAYQPGANRTGEDSFTYATKSGAGTLRLMLEADTKASTRVAYVLNDALPTCQGIPLRLTVQSEREAPTLTLTDCTFDFRHSPEHSAVAIHLASIEATARNPAHSLKVELGDLPEGSILRDAHNTFIATGAHAAVEITYWHCGQLTLIPPRACPEEFILRVQVTETGQDAETGAQKTRGTVAGFRVMTQAAKPGNAPDDELQAEKARSMNEAVAARPGASASITIRSSLPKAPFAPARKQSGYILLNHGPHAKPRHPRADKPETVPAPRIDWNAKAPDWDVVKTPEWIVETFEQQKEKPRTLGEITGLVFPIPEQEK
jgi:hypothetical protein